VEKLLVVNILECMWYKKSWIHGLVKRKGLAFVLKNHPAEAKKHKSNSRYEE